MGVCGVYLLVAHPPQQRNTPQKTLESWKQIVAQSSVAVRDDEHRPPEIDIPANQYLREHDAITCIMDCYIRGARAGDADLMRSALHSEATISGYCQGVEYGGSIQHVLDWISANGPAPTSRHALQGSKSSRASRLFTSKCKAGPTNLSESTNAHQMSSVSSSSRVSGRSLTSCSTGMMIELLRRRLDHLAGPTTRKRLSCAVEK